MQVLAKDLYGNPVIGALNVGPGEIEAMLRGPDTIDLTPVKTEAGCLTLGYTAMKAGMYDLSITHDGRHISGSPWKVRSPSLRILADLSFSSLH
jgi:Filamin/ABP280 repeat